MTDRTILAIDPSNTRHAWVVMDNSYHIYGFGRDLLKERSPVVDMATEIWIEMIASYGMPVGREVFETCLNIGELSVNHPDAHLITRQQAKLAICYSARANDSNIRTALIDLFGGAAQTKKGGKLYGIAGDCWAALAIAVAVCKENITPYRRARDTEDKCKI